jgi:hypothetical protein
MSLREAALDILIKAIDVRANTLYLVLIAY